MSSRHCVHQEVTHFTDCLCIFLVEIVIWITKIEDNGKGAKVTKYLDISIQKKKTDISMYYDVLQN